MIAAGPGDVIVQLLLGVQDLIEVVLDQVADADDAARASQSITSARRMRCLVMIAMTLDNRSFAAPDPRPISTPVTGQLCPGGRVNRLTTTEFGGTGASERQSTPPTGSQVCTGLENHVEPA